MNDIVKVGNKIKCVVWDLDNTVWDGILLEEQEVRLRDGIVDIIKTLDKRGILQSIASKNDHKSTIEKLKELGIAHYFIYPQINWNSKASSIQVIAKSINIGIDTLAFIDDQPFEREEVKFSVPEILCIDAAVLDGLLDMDEMNPRFITEDSEHRRQVYLSDIERNNEEANYVGAQEEFLASLNMKFTVALVGENDLQRVEELTVRTHQLNATGYTYSYEELEQLRKSGTHKLFIAQLEDKFGTYGKIGFAMVECTEKIWTLKILIMSCRVMSRGVGSVLLNYIMTLAKKANVRLQAEFVPTDKNRMMYITYKFAGFKEISESENFIVFENDLENISQLPNYLKVDFYQ